jgi:predicted DNA-binding protein (MmcQ/YjbR family)
VTADALQEKCLAMPGAVEEFPFGPAPSVFKVGGKIFAISDLESRPLQVSLKCEPELAVQLRATYPAIAPGYHLNKRHWNTVTVDGSISDATVSDMIEDSYDLVRSGLSKAATKRLGLHQRAEP